MRFVRSSMALGILALICFLWQAEAWVHPHRPSQNSPPPSFETLDDIVHTRILEAKRTQSHVVVLVDFISPDYVNTTTFVASVGTLNSFLACDTSIFFGTTDLGTHIADMRAMVPHTLPNAYVTSGQLYPGRGKVASPLSQVVILCNAGSASAGDTLSVTLFDKNNDAFTSSVDVELSGTPDSCVRSQVEFSLDGEMIDGATAAAAAADTVNQIHSSFKGLVSTVPGDTYVSLTSSSAVLRICSTRSADDPLAEANGVALGFHLKNQMSIVVYTIAMPIFETHIGPSIGSVDMKRTALGQYSDIMYKCSSKANADADHFSVSNCVLERCTGLAVYTTRCFFGNAPALDEAECAMAMKPTPSSSAQCDVQVVDVGCMFSEDASNNLFQLGTYIRYHNEKELDVSSPDFPALRIFVHLPGANTMVVETVIILGPDMIGKIVESSRVELTSEGIFFDVLGELGNHIVRANLSPGPKTVAEWLLSSVYSSRSVIAKHSPDMVFYDSSNIPAPPARMAFDPEMRAVEITAHLGALPGWVDLSRPLAVFAISDDPVFASLDCSLGSAPSLDAVNKAILNGSDPSVFTPEWLSSLGVIPQNRLHMHAFAASTETSIDPDAAVRCFGSVPEDADLPTKLGLMFWHVSPFSENSFDSLFYSLRSMAIKPAWVHQPRTILHIPISSDGDALRAATAFSAAIPTWLNNSVAITGVSAVENGQELKAIAMRVAPQMSLYLPSPVMIATALPRIAQASVRFREGIEVDTLSFEEFYSPAEQGRWLCGADGVFKSCEVDSSQCATEYLQPQHCVQNLSALAVTEFAAHVACAFNFNASLPPLPETSGCGKLLCRLSSEEFVSCNDSRICINGCAAGVQLTEELIEKSDSFAPMCVKNGEAADMAHCNPNLVEPVVYASKCDATSSCGTVCFGQSGTRVGCDDENAWSGCSDPCRGGTKARNAHCADNTTTVGESVTEVPVSFCPGGVLDVSTSESCDGDIAFCPGPIVFVTPISGSDHLYSVSWDDAEGMLDLSAGNAQIYLIVDSVPGKMKGTVIQIANVPADSKSYELDSSSPVIASGTYKAAVKIGDVQTGMSAIFTVVPTCAGKECGNGVCNTSTAACDCRGDWTGDACQVDPCASKGCNVEGSNCSEENGIATCHCFTDPSGKPIFIGNKCDIAANYCELKEAPCKNGGSRSGRFTPAGSYVCDACECTHAWESSTNCGTCGLVCAHNTAANADCATCNCPALGGLSGNLCQCRNAYMTFIVRDNDVSFDAVDAEFSRRFGSEQSLPVLDELPLLFASDIAAATTIRRVELASALTNHTSLAGTLYYKIILSVSPVCNGQTPVQDDYMLPTYEAIAKLKTYLGANAHKQNKLVALSFMHMRSGFAAHDPLCRLDGDGCPTGWRANGVFTDSDGALDCSGADAIDPACREQHVKGSGGLSTGAIVGIAVGGSVALILLVLLVMCIAKIGCFAPSFSFYQSPTTEMVSV